MLGAIAGDMIGSVFEYSNFKSKDFPLFCEDSTFTDDTVLTVAVAHAIMTDGDYASALKSFGRKYPRRGYGGFFQDWLKVWIKIIWLFFPVFAANIARNVVHRTRPV